MIFDSYLENAPAKTNRLVIECVISMRVSFLYDWENRL